MFTGTTFAPISFSEKARSSRSSRVSPMPMIPPEQILMPAAFRYWMVSMRSSYVCVEQVCGKNRRELSRLCP